MHQFIKKIQETSFAGKIRAKVQAETAKAIETLINEADEIPGVGKLVAKIDTVGEEVFVQLGVNRSPASSTLERTQG
jgi:hypothetical protein